MAIDDAVSAPVGFPAIIKAELLAAQARFVSHVRLAPVDVPVLVDAFPGLISEIAGSAAAANATNPEIQIFLPEDVTKQMAKRDSSKYGATKLQACRRESDSWLSRS